MEDQQVKLRQREALENLGTSLVDPHIQQLFSISSPSQSMAPSHPAIGLGCASLWLVVIFLYCWCVGGNGR